MATSAGRYCYHFNGTGSTAALTDMTGAVVNSYAYDPFGQILGQQETIAQPFKYVGQYGVMAEPNGLYYMRARYYDPTVGRFISEDPLGFGGGDVNLSAYVQNNPVNMIDPDGKNPVLIAILAGVYYFVTHHEVANAPTSPCEQLYDHDVAYNPQVQLGIIPIGGPSSSLILQNAARGLEFESSVIDAIPGATKNTTSVTVPGLGTSIPDLMGDGITEIKSGINLSFTRQLQIQAGASEGPFNLIVSPSTQNISGPLEQAVTQSGGAIQVFNPVTGAFRPWVR
ncbi:hypothetical protein SBDP1_520001 [Syntrophobacter sp. SbD1]|nr:hypothetical protein SBDP1_520001 [Syntrophobacter sp. SbD1]